MSRWLSAVYVELGLKVLVSSPRDVKILCLQRFVRLFAYGCSTLVLTLFLRSLGNSAEKIGLFMTLTLLGDVVISLILTVVADKIGRRRILALGSLLMTASGIVFALFSQYWILVLASIFGVISPSGSEIGPFRAVEESTLSQLISPIDRSSVLAWYSLLGFAGAAAGSVSIGWVVYTLQDRSGWTTIESYRLVFWIYAGLGLVKFVLSLLLSVESEVKSSKLPRNPLDGERQPLLADAHQPDQVSKDQKTRGWLLNLLPQLSTHTTSLITKLCFLFALDSLGSGMASNAWIVYFLNDKFGMEEGKLGSVFFVTNILASVSNLVAASVARRIGLIKTMVFTHLPASITLALLPLPNNEIITVVLLFIRYSMSSMDTAPRQAFLAAAVLPEERTTVMGVVNVCKTLSQAGGPVVVGAFADVGKLGAAFVFAGALKCAYDVLMLGMFLGYKTVEERAETEVVSANPEQRQQAPSQG